MKLIVKSKKNYYILYFHSTHDCGIVVCPKCHSIIDKFYHLEKKYENTEN